MASDSKPVLSRQSIIEAAIAMADEGGLDAVSMRKLGQRLGVEAMSLYHYVPSKTEIVREMVATILARMEHPSRDLPWRQAIERASRSAVYELHAHPWVIMQIVRPEMANVSERFGWMNAILGCLRHAGFSVYLTHQTYHAIDGHIISVAFRDSSVPSSKEDRDRLLEGFSSVLETGDYPWLVEHIQYHQEHDDDTDPDDSEFEYTLRLILDGVEKRFADEQAER